MDEYYLVHTRAWLYVWHPPDRACVQPLIGPGLARDPPWLPKKDIETVFSNVRMIWQVRYRCCSASPTEPHADACPHVRRRRQLNQSFLNDVTARLQPVLSALEEERPMLAFEQGSKVPRHLRPMCAHPLTERAHS